MAAAKRNHGAKGAPAPLDAAALRALAVRYVERYQTTRLRLLRFLQRKLRERGFEEGAALPDLEALVEQMAGIGYVDDRSFAAARARALARRGMGRLRIDADLQASGIDAVLRTDLLEAADPFRLAVDFARRKRLGPFGAPFDASSDAGAAGRNRRNRQLAAFARAGHPRRLALRILDAQSEDELVPE